METDMKLLRWTALGALAYAFYKTVTRANVAGARLDGGAPKAAAGDEATGLSAIYNTRESAELAVEHLVQEHKVDRATIFIEPVGTENSTGVEQGGADGPATGGPATDGHARSDSPLHGALQLTVPTENHDHALIEKVLREAGAEEVRAL
jgi:hypothetical protein